MKAIGGVWCQQDTNMNLYHVAYLLQNMLPAKQIYKIHDVEMSAIIDIWKNWRHYLEEAAQTILVLTDHNNRKKFMKMTCLSGQQIW